MKANERRWAVVQAVYSSPNPVPFSTLCNDIPESQVTAVSNDLRGLLDLGIIVKIGHGLYAKPAALRAQPGSPSKFQLKQAHLVREKAAIARFAVETLISKSAQNTVIALDGGTQVTAVAAELANAPVEVAKIFTCNYAAAKLLCQAPNINSLTIRFGDLLKDYEVLSGPVNDLDKSIGLDLAILGISGLSSNLEVSSVESSQHSWKRLLLESAPRVFVLATHDKIGRRRGIDFGNLSLVQGEVSVLTDNNHAAAMTKAEEKEWSKTIAALGDKVVVVDQDGQAVEPKLATWEEPKLTD